MPDYYFMTGDETINDAIVDGPKDRYLNQNAWLNNGELWNSRAIGGELMGTARLGQFLQAIGDSDASAVLAQGVKTYNLQVKPSMCLSGYPTGCNPGTADNPIAGTTGVSLTRGAPYGWQGGGPSCASNNVDVRWNAAFQASILLEGIWELRQAEGPSWADYNNSLDLAYGISSWALTEMYVDDGTGGWVNNGFRYYESLDTANACDTTSFPVRPNQTVWFPFFIQYVYKGTTEWQQKFNMALQKDAAATATDEFGNFTIANVIDQLNTPASGTLVNVPVTAVNNGGGSYTLSWTAPANAQSYTVKTGTQQVVDWIGFNPATNQFIGNPTSTMPWFAANTVANPPVTAAAGNTQTATVTGLAATGQFFALKAMVSGSGTSGPAPVISGVTTSSITSSTATISWTTDTASDSQVAYGTTSAYGSLSALNSTLVTAHSIGLSGLAASTAYHFQVMSRNAQGVLASSADFTFTTGSIAAPVISAVSAGSITSSSAIIGWTTDTASDSQVAYGPTTAYGSLSPLNSTLVTAHSVSLSGLAASTAYHFQVLSRNAQGVLASSADSSFTTTSGGGSTPLPLNTWTMIPTHGVPAQLVGWEKLVYSPALKKSVMMGDYHELGSEPNEALVAYDFNSNRWDVLEFGDSFHTESMSEAGHPVGRFVYNPNLSVFTYYCCPSQSATAESVNHTWWFDPVGQVGRDKFTAPKPGLTPVEASSAFDSAHNKMILYGSGVGTWMYDPSVNSWQLLSPTYAVQGGGTFPATFAALAEPAMAYDSSGQKIYMFGGRLGYGSGDSFVNDLYSYDVGANTWTLLNPSGARPAPREMAALAYDSTNHVFLLFGGFIDNPTDQTFADTWIYDPVANSWTQLNPVQSPPGGTFEHLAYDSDDNAFVMAVAGLGGYADGSWNAYSVQTWLFRYQGTGPNPGGTSFSAPVVSASLNRNANGWAKEPSLASSGANLYAAWVETGSPFDTSNAAWSHVQVSQLTGSNWTALGSSNLAINSEFNGYIESFSPSVAFSGGLPWVSYYQSNNSGQSAQIYVKNWTGTSWQGGALGLVGSPATQGPSQLTDVAGVPHIAFLEVENGFYPQKTLLYVKYWNGTQWVLKGSGPLNQSTATTTAGSLSIVSDGTNPYVAWTEYTTADSVGQSQTNPQVYVAHWNGTQWVLVGGPLNMNSSGIGWAFDASIAFLSGQPYVAWTERSMNGNSQVFVKTFNGTQWVLVGSGTLNKDTNTGWAFHPSLIADPASGSLYLGWVEQQALGQHSQAYVAKFSNGAWTSLGGSLNFAPAAGSAQRISLVMFGGQAVATWGEVQYGTMRQVFAKQWNGSNWVSPTGTAVPTPTCDLNGDGVVTSADVQIAINQALGTTPCGSADLLQNGQCSIIDVQRVINASLGGTCRIGP